MVLNKFKLLIVTSLPVLFSIIFFYFEDKQPSNAALGFLTLIALSAGAIYYSVYHSFFKPHQQLLRQLEISNQTIDLESIEALSAASELAIAFNSNSLKFRYELETSLAGLKASESRLKASNKQAESRLENTSLILSQFQQDYNFNKMYNDCLTQICNKPLMDLNKALGPMKLSLQHSGDPYGLENDIENSIENKAQAASRSYKGARASKQLRFLINELQHQTFLIQEETHFDIHKVTDDVLVLLHPLLEKHKAEIYVSFDVQCQMSAQGHPELLEAMLFHFLLSQIVNGEFFHQKTLKLKVHFPISGCLEFVLSPKLLNYDFRSTARLDELALCLDARIDKNRLITRIKTTLSPIRSLSGLITAKVISDQPLKHRSLCSRVKNLGLSLITEGSADIYFVEFERVEEIESLVKDVPGCAQIYFLNDATFSLKNNWHQIGGPLEQSLIYRKISAQLNPNQTYRILSVDDQTANLHLLSVMLEDLGHQVKTLNSPLTAIQWCKTNAVDLIFMDLKMPEMSGSKASRIIRDNGFRGPIIALTAHLSEGEKSETAAAGMTTVLLKPINKKRLKATISNYFFEGPEPHFEPQVPHPSTQRPKDQPLTTLIPDTTRLFDPALAFKRANKKKSLAAELLTLLMETIRADQTEFNDLFNDNQCEAFRSAIHRLLGAIRYCGTPRLEFTIGELERITKQDLRLTTPETTQALSALNTEIEALITWHQNVEDPFA